MEESLIENNNQIAEVFSASTLRAIVSFINDNNIQHKDILKLFKDDDYYRLIYFKAIWVQIQKI